MMKSDVFVTMANYILNLNTTYATGAFGASIGNFPAQLERYCKNSPDLAKTIRERAAKPPCFAFDCVGMVKGILWGFTGKADSVYGGAAYESNGVPDFGTGIIDKCSDVSKDFSKIVPGELLWMSGHVGIYIGNSIMQLIMMAYYLLFGFAFERLVYASVANSVFDRFINPHIEGAPVRQGLRPQTEEDELFDDEEDEDDEKGGVC